jgi:endonuclease-3
VATAPKKTPSATAKAKAAKPSTKGNKQLRARAQFIVEALAQEYPDATCELNFTTPFELLCATIMSAQSTDKMVNTLTPTLFARYPTPLSLAQADPADVETIIHSSGFFRAKARNLIGMAQALVRDFGGEVPRSMQAMLTLPGVARKTANVVLGTAYGLPTGITVDTHVTRLAQRLGLTKETDAPRIEQELLPLVPQSEWIDLGHRVIWHGRRVCHARQPLCQECVLAEVCPSKAPER